MKSRLHRYIKYPYYIYAPDYRETSSGVVVLHYLCHALNLAGADAYITPSSGVNARLKTPLLTNELKARHLREGRIPIAIYPEVVKGNPLKLDVCVRYLLNRVGVHTGESMDAGPDDMIVYYSELFADQEEAELDFLRVPILDSDMFKPDPTRPKTRTLIYQNRFPLQKIDFSQFPADAELLSLAKPLPLSELVALFQSAKVLYSYELSATCTLAMMCGCPVIYAEGGYMQTPPSVETFGANGAAMLSEVDGLARATATVAAIHPIVAALEDKFWVQLETFLDKTQSRGLKNASKPVKKNLLIFSAESPLSPCPQIRLLRPFSHLADEWNLIWAIEDGRLAPGGVESADAILLHRFTPGMFPLKDLQTIFALGKPVIYETDDLLNEMPEYHPQGGAAWKEGIEYTLRHANAVVVSTQYLADKYAAFNRSVHVLPNFVDFNAFYQPVPQPHDDQITIGLLGTSIQSPNFDLVDAALRSLCERYGERLKIIFMGWEVPAGWENHPNAEFLPVIVAYEDYIMKLHEMAWDIALVPLAIDDFNRSKSAIKWLEYSAAGIASVFSDVAIYNAVVTNGETGLLASDSKDGWVDAITSLIEDAGFRQRIATAAQLTVRTHYSLDVKASMYGDLYQQLVKDAEAQGSDVIPAAMERNGTQCIVVYSADAANSPCSEIRLLRPFALLSDRWKFIWAIDRNRLGGLAHLAKADIVVLHRTIVAMMPRPMLDSILNCGKPVIYESDDLLNEIPEYHRDATIVQKEAIEYTISRVHAVVVSSRYLADKYRALNPEVHVLPNYIDFDLFYRPVPKNGGKLIIGLLGTSIQAPNFRLVDQALRKIQEKYGDLVQIDIWGFHIPQGWESNPGIRFIPVNYDYESYSQQLKGLNWDIALVPLAEDDFNRSKSPIKWLEYSSLGIASIFSDIAVYRDVIEHNRTGMLIRDVPDDWYAAMDLLISDPARRQLLAAEAQKEVREKYSLKRNVAQYDALYHRLAVDIRARLDIVASSASSKAALQSISVRQQVPRRLVVLSAESTWSPCPQIRFLLPFSFLKDQWKLIWGIKDGKVDFSEVANADLVVLHRSVPGLFPLADLQTIFSLDKTFIYETDDLLNDFPDYHPQAESAKAWKQGIEYAIRHAHALVVSTQFLADKYHAMNAHVHVLPNYLDFDRFYRPVPIKSGLPVTIGLLGTSIQGPNFSLVDSALRKLCEQYPGQIKLYFVGWSMPSDWEGHPAVEYIPFIHEYSGYAARLLEMEWDIALIPLVDDDFNQSKSAIKWLEYSAAGIASIFSDISVYRNVVNSGQNGLLVSDSPEDWYEAIHSLIAKPALRQRLAGKAQTEVRKHYALRERSALYNEIYSEIADAALPAPTSAPAAAPTMAIEDAQIEAVLVLDQESDHEKLLVSLQSLQQESRAHLVVVVLTTREGDIPEWTEKLRFLRATKEEYPEARQLLSTHPDFKWLATLIAGTEYGDA